MTSTAITCTCPVETPAPSMPAVGCCGGPAPQGTHVCCVLDADIKAVGGTGCGCGTPAPAPALATPSRTRSGCC